MGKLTHIFIKDNIAPFMKQSGYKKKRYLFTKETDQFKFSIEFQQSGGNWHDNETFYINCYIYSEEFADIVGSTFYQYMKRIEGITKSSYSRFDITTTTNIKKLEKTILNDIEKVMVFFNSIINMEAFIKILFNKTQV